MVFKIRILILSALMIAKVFGDMDCKAPLLNCKFPKFFEQIPREVSEFNELCPELKVYLKCLKDYQDSCDSENKEIFKTPDLFEAAYATVSDLCEEGTSLNTAAIENVACFNETLSKTNCRKESYDAVAPYWEEQENNTDHPFDDEANFICLAEALIYECLGAAVSEKCGQVAEEAMLDFILRSKLLENPCTVEGVKSLFEEMDNFNLTEYQRSSVTASLEKFVERNKD